MVNALGEAIQISCLSFKKVETGYSSFLNLFFSITANAATTTIRTAGIARSLYSGIAPCCELASGEGTDVSPGDVITGVDDVDDVVVDG
jgi:hypothetical protein